VFPVGRLPKVVKSTQQTLHCISHVFALYDFGSEQQQSDGASAIAKFVTISAACYVQLNTGNITRNGTTSR
jgi:hypothetical protein